jgi:hypothetical protein
VFDALEHRFAIKTAGREGDQWNRIRPLVQRVGAFEPDHRLRKRGVITGAGLRFLDDDNVEFAAAIASGQIGAQPRRLSRASCIATRTYEMQIIS